MLNSSGEITDILSKWQQGDQDALDQLMVEVYQDLKRTAAFQLANETPDHTLQPTALVNEAFLRLLPNKQWVFPDRKCFFHFMSMLMRRILVSYAREKLSQKRGGRPNKVAVDLEKVLPGKRWDPVQMLALDELLHHLKALDPRKHQLIELWFFAGLDANEIGQIFSKSPITIRRELRTTKCWLAKKLEGTSQTTPEAFFT